MYPYIIPFSGSATAADPTLRPHTVYQRQHVTGTDVSWDQPWKIPPVEPQVREIILTIEADFQEWMGRLTAFVPHLPSRLRSQLWVVCAIPTLEGAGCVMPPYDVAVDCLLAQLPGLSDAQALGLRRQFRPMRRGGGQFAALVEAHAVR